MVHHHPYNTTSSGITGESEDSGVWIDQIFQDSTGCTPHCVNETHNALDWTNEAESSYSNVWNNSFNYDVATQFEDYFNEAAIGRSGENLEGIESLSTLPWSLRLLDGSNASLDPNDLPTTGPPEPQTPNQASHNDLAQEIQHDPTIPDPLNTYITAEDDDSDAAMGTALKNGLFKCILKQCADITFKRSAELKRHYNTIHAAKKPEFWCNVLSCDRSAAAGGRPFHRKDKLQDHVQRIHGHRHGNDMVQE